MKLSRRNFMQHTAAAGAALAATRLTPYASAAAPDSKQQFRTLLQKALIEQTADDATCEKLTKAGFFGVELMKKDVTLEQGYEGRRTAEKHGVKIHSFMGGWADFNNSDEAKRRASIEDVRRLIRLSAAYGASTILLVPCRVGGMAMPKPSQFKYDFDRATLKVKGVVDGDNAPFADYIAAHNRATELSCQAIEELIPEAAKEGVVIGLENVWNNLWVMPDIADAFTRHFDTPWVRAYFDLGNHVRYAPTEEWLKVMARNIVKLHIKDFKVDRAKNNDGDFVPIGKGSIDWVSVRKAIDDAGYNGWVSIESGGYTEAEHSKLMDNIFAGQGAVLT